MSEMDELMTLKDVQKVLHIGRQSLYTLVRTRALGAYVVGNQYRVSREQLDKYLAGQRTRRV